MKVTTGISVEAETLMKAKKKASKLRRTFSNYVEGLIMKDLRIKVINDSHSQSTKTDLQRRAKS